MNERFSEDEIIANYEQEFENQEYGSGYYRAGYIALNLHARLANALKWYCGLDRIPVKDVPPPSIEDCEIVGRGVAALLVVATGFIATRTIFSSYDI